MPRITAPEVRSQRRVYQNNDRGVGKGIVPEAMDGLSFGGGDLCQQTGEHRLAADLLVEWSLNQKKACCSDLS